MPQCKAHTSAGNPCRRNAILGGVVCASHGGSTPQVQRKARQRLDDMVLPALRELRGLIHTADSDASKLRAIENVLDRTGYKLPERIEADNAVTIRVEYESGQVEAGQVIEATYSQALKNGAAHGSTQATDNGR